jgi:hypothetical protein
MTELLSLPTTPEAEIPLSDLEIPESSRWYERILLLCNWIGWVDRSPVSARHRRACGTGSELNHR